MFRLKIYRVIVLTITLTLQKKTEYAAIDLSLSFGHMSNFVHEFALYTFEST